MRLCAWAGARRLLSVLVLLTADYVQAEQQLPKERHYYIAAVEIDWNYSGNDWHRWDLFDLFLISYDNYRIGSSGCSSFSCEIPTFDYVSSPYLFFVFL